MLSSCLQTSSQSLLEKKKNHLARQMRATRDYNLHFLLLDSKGWYVFHKIFMSVKPLTWPSATAALGEVVLPGRLLKFCCSVHASASYLRAQGSSWHSRCSRALRLSGRNQQSSSKSEIPKSAVLTDPVPLVNSPFSSSSSVILPFLNFFKSLVSLRSSSMSSSSISEP